MTLILLTNDDGIDAEGLRCLEENLRGLAHLIVVAPDSERSAVSHALTLKSPIEHTERGPNRYSVNGTPADCIIYSIRRILAQPPALVVSGINHGANLGDDVIYSGTVAGAREASKNGIPAIAFSQAYDKSEIEFEQGGRFARALVQTLLHQRPRGSVCLNVNIPVDRIRGVKITRQGSSSYFKHFNALDRRPRRLFGVSRQERAKNKTVLDFQAIVDQYISITPLHHDQTDYSALDALRSTVAQIPLGTDD